MVDMLYLLIVQTKHETMMHVDKCIHTFTQKKNRYIHTIINACILRKKCIYNCANSCKKLAIVDEQLYKHPDQTGKRDS